MMNKKLVLKRNGELNNRARSYKLFINDEYFEDINRNEEKIIVVNSNTVNLVLKIDWCKSKKHEIKFRDNENQKEFEISSSISNKLWNLIVAGMIFSILLFFILRINFFGILAVGFVLIPFYKITIDRNNYLIVKEVKT
ncbi:hypothetical protein [uncultured Tenacibaculum sp.]|uniref:hypothetical protein n=1 Tax=uncultured Tenacibaculum sp. TaxID=174713 RepID=UPI002623D863|nr:hypothetical protein [uncultured Tenacibaculum sp.]